jgi:spore maturation protein CgeB
MQFLIQAGFDVALYGGYWERYPSTAPFARGYADLPTLRKAIGAAKVALCLVRRANRDGHCMRSFEVPAIGACMLTEDTVEHREIFGEDGRAVVYFHTRDEMVDKLRWLLAHDEERRRLADAARLLITAGGNTYRDRVEAMLKTTKT